MSNLTVFNLKLDRETLKRLTDQTKDSKARIVKDENNLVTLDLADQRIKIEQSKRGSEMAVFYQRDTPASNQLQLVGIPACNTFARASKRTTAAAPNVDKVKSHSASKESPSTPTKPKKKSSSKNNNNNNNNSSSSPYVRPLPSPVKLDSTIDLPLEERLIHLLALCPHSINALSKKLNSSALDVSQKIKKVAIPLKDVGTSSTKYILKPRLYSQIRIWDWPLYSSTERREVASNVEEGYNLLRLPPDAPERQNLSQSSTSPTKKSSLIQPPPGKVNTQTERDRKIAAKKKLNDASPLYNNHTPNPNISQSRAIPPTNTTPTTTTTTISTSTSTTTTATTPNSLQPTAGTGSNNNNNNNANSNSSSTVGAPKLSTSTKSKGKMGHASSLSPVAPPQAPPPNHHHTTNNNTPTNKSQSLKPPNLNTSTSSSTGTTPIAKTSNSPSNITHHHASAPSTTSANTPVHRSRGKSPNIFYKPKVSTHDTTGKKRKSSHHGGNGTTRKKQKLSYKRLDIHNQAEFDHLCKEYNQQHTNYLRDLQQFRSENPVYLKVLESVPPQKSNREYAQRLRQSYDKDDFAKMLEKTQSFFSTKTYVDGMWDNILEYADLYKINPL